MLRYFNRRVVRTFSPDSGKHTYESVNIIAQNLETIISMNFCHMRFVDSLQFLNSSLENLVDNLAKSCGDNFCKLVHTNRHFKRVNPSLFENKMNKLLYRKGIFCYERFDSLDKLNATELSPKEEFYSQLNECDISSEDYEYAHEI